MTELHFCKDCVHGENPAFPFLPYCLMARNTERMNYATGQTEFTTDTGKVTPFEYRKCVDYNTDGKCAKFVRAPAPIKTNRSSWAMFWKFLSG